MSNKRPFVNLGGLVAQSSKEAKRTAASAPSGGGGGASSSASTNNLFLSRPVPKPEEAVGMFLIQSRAAALRKSANGSGGNVPPIEIEARLGTLVSPHLGPRDARALSSGAKVVQVQGKERVVHAFVCNVSDGINRQNGRMPATTFEGGVTRSNYLRWTQAGLSEASAVSAAYSCRGPRDANESEGAALKSQLEEREAVTTVYAFPDGTRSEFPHEGGGGRLGRGRSERKEKLSVIDLALPAAPYDLRLTCASEQRLDDPGKGSINPANVAPNWDKERIKRRRSYTRRDNSFAWRMDVTEVTTTDNPGPNGSLKGASHPKVGYEIEMELSSSMTKKLISTRDDAEARKLAGQLGAQLWFMVQQLNPTHDVLEVEEFLREHPDGEATKMALGQCQTIRKFVDSKCQSWQTAIAPGGGRSPDNHEWSRPPRNFVGCMPVNFSRHNIEEVQRSDGSEGGYFLSEKTDGVRYLLVFTGSTAVLVDRASHETKKAYQPKPRGNGAGGDDPLSNVLGAFRPGAVLDGEVVVHRKLRRPIFIVFDVLANAANEPVLHLPFERRLEHLKNASFVKKGAGVDVFDPKAVSNLDVALPLVRKNFVRRMELDRLLSHVVEERGARTYRSGETHHHLTDGIIFQPNSPYVCGTDMGLLKWKYLDTVTIDVEILPLRRNDDEDTLRVGVMGEEGTSVDMTRYLRLPSSERHRLEADKNESGSKIAEVGFDPATGEWYYRTMRPDKTAPNHISTVLGTLLELAESLSTEELRFRMSVPGGQRDTYARDARNMQRQLLEHQRRRNRGGGR